MINSKNKMLLEKGGGIYDYNNLAFSGGKDSICFAHLLKSKGYEVRLCHVNNTLPGDDLIKEKVKIFAKKFNFNLAIDTSPPISGGGLENSCRQARIKSFQYLRKIIVCHHLGDCVENYLKNCFRGTPEYKPMNFIGYWGKTQILRPFLTVSPQEIDSYLDKHDLKQYIAHDPISESSERHWMRNSIIPEINGRAYNLFRVVKKMMIKQLENLNE